MHARVQPGGRPTKSPLGHAATVEGAMSAVDHPKLGHSWPRGGRADPNAPRDPLAGYCRVAILRPVEDTGTMMFPSRCPIRGSPAALAFHAKHVPVSKCVHRGCGHLFAAVGPAGQGGEAHPELDKEIVA
jgi:hypothetical protein